ncbi:hypothetical protein QUF72_10285 [Desulfobacterales bacterium HSG2]|nr:hypothetical protein [Desulfobacterales bacterium HSG2]
MNILDENILNDQRQLLRMRRITSRQIGDDTGRKGMQDEEIIPLLHRSDRPTFFTRDNDLEHHSVMTKRPTLNPIKLKT